MSYKERSVTSSKELLQDWPGEPKEKRAKFLNRTAIFQAKIKIQCLLNM
jgi:hypothetical protein